MEILNISNKYNIKALYQGHGNQAYIFHSSFFGFFGYANVNEIEDAQDKIKIDVYMADVAYITEIKKALKKYETQFIEKEIFFEFHILDSFSDNVRNHTHNVLIPISEFKLKLYDGVTVVKTIEYKG